MTFERPHHVFRPRRRSWYAHGGKAHGTEAERQAPTEKAPSPHGLGAFFALENDSSRRD